MSNELDLRDILEATKSGFQSVEGILGDSSSRISGLERELAVISASVERMEHILDGDPPLPERLRVVEERVRVLQKNNTALAAKLWDVAKPLILAAIGALVGAASMGGL